MDAKKQSEALGQELWERYAWGATKKYLQQIVEVRDGEETVSYITLKKYSEDGTGNTKAQLLPYMLAQHVRQTKTYGVFSGEKAASFICFDIDGAETGSIQTQPRETYMMVEGVIEALIDLGIPENGIVTSWSGLKGFHVEVFFDMPTALWLHEKLYRLTLIRAGLEGMSYKIEPRPLPGRGVKLPLGKNLKNPDPDSNICSFVNPFNGYAVIDDLEYIKRVPRVASGLVYEIWQKNALDFSVNEKLITPTVTVAAKSNDIDLANSETPPAESVLAKKMTPKQRIPSARPNAKELLKNGLPGERTRVNSFISLAAHFKMEELLSKEDAFVKITEWFTLQPKKGRYRTDYDIAIKELGKIVDTIYNYKETPINSIKLSKDEIDGAFRLPKASEQAVYLAFLVHAKRFRRPEFFMTYDQLQAMTGLSRRPVADAKKTLLARGYLVEIPRLKEARRGYKSPCCYRLPEVLVTSGKRYFEVQSNIIITKAVLNRLAEQLCKGDTYS